MRPGNLGDTHFWFGNTNSLGNFGWVGMNKSRRKEMQRQALQQKAASIAKYMMQTGAPTSMAMSMAGNDRSLAQEIQNQIRNKQAQQRRQAQQAKREAELLAQGIKKCGPAPTHDCPPQNCISRKGRPCPPIGGGPHRCTTLPGQRKPQWVCHRRLCPHCQKATTVKKPAVVKTKIAPASKVTPKTTPKATPKAAPKPAASSAKEAAIRRCVNNLKQKIAAKMITTVPVCGRGSCTEAEFRAKCGG